MPLAALVTVIQFTALDTAQVQPLAAVTVTDPTALAALTEALPGEIETVQGTPACVTVNVWPAIVKVPERKIELVFLIPQKSDLIRIREKMLNKVAGLSYLHDSKPAEFYFTAIDGTNLKAVLSVWIHNQQAPGYLQIRHEVLLLATDILREEGIVN